LTFVPDGCWSGNCHDVGAVFKWGVIRAVAEFAAARRLRFGITDPQTGHYGEPLCCAGWYLLKPPAGEDMLASLPAGLAEARCHTWWLRAAVPCFALLAGNSSRSDHPQRSQSYLIT